MPSSYLSRDQVRDVDRRAWVLHQRRVDAHLVVARRLHRVYFRTEEIGAEEIVGDPQRSGRVAF